jgi:hypothetical protein
MAGEDILGGISGSREPDPCSTGSGPTGFDPGRVEEAEREFQRCVARQLDVREAIAHAERAFQQLESMLDKARDDCVAAKREWLAAKGIEF